ncbi:nickel/cobalt transporter [Salmonella enterica]|nr:nickel/cobalt transporter [Salmonella enterica]EEG8010426.1 nickel/cobalt transporter [Salmonella enterica subsp. enterica serovar 4,[5],12:i:-]EEJ7080017.1 nickel/cobalt transporter [Salmonella enterica]EGF6272274.1 nickel/cobalt transporter [Salmonella enterica subsp. enterica serovar 4,[5],12:i:-]
MSVIFSQRTPGRRWLSLWPLALFLLLMLVGGLWMWQAWPQVMLKSALWQRDVNQQLSALLNAVATHPSKLKSSIVLTLAAALLQGLVAIGLVVGVLTVLQLPARQLHLSGFWLEKGSYALVGGLGILLCWRAIKRLRALLRKPVFIAFTPRHVHHEKCGCGHQHLPTQEQLHSGDDWRARFMIVLSMGMRPCSGAIMVLLFSKVIGVFSWGMASVLAMAAGTSLTITSLALLVHTFRALAVKLSGNKAPALWRQVGWSTLALAGGGILLVAALVMWFSVPQPVGGLRPWRG